MELEILPGILLFLICRLQLPRKFERRFLLTKQNDKTDISSLGGTEDLWINVNSVPGGRTASDGLDTFEASTYPYKLHIRHPSDKTGFQEVPSFQALSVDIHFGQYNHRVCPEQHQDHNNSKHPLDGSNL